MKKKIVGIFVMMLLIATALQAVGTMNIVKDTMMSSVQNNGIEWEKTYGGDEADKFLDVQETDDGGYIASGTTEESNNHCPWVMRVDSEGNEIWNWTITEFYYNDTFFDITYSYCGEVKQTNDGGYIACFMLEFDYNEVERLLGGLVKLDSNGAEEWMQIYGDEFEWTILPESIMVVDDGFVGVGAHTTPLEEPPDIGRALCVFKTDSSGELQWHQAYRYGGYINNWARGFCSTDDGGYLIVGDLRISANHWDAVMVKTDSNGYEEWNQTFGGSAPGWETFEDVFQTNDGGYIICGTTESFGAGSGDAWLLRTDATGNEIWNKTFGERYYDVCWGFDSTDDGGYIIPIRIDIMGVNADGWAVKVDSDGIVEWKHIYGESGGRQHFVGICSTSDDGCIASGVSGGWDSIMSDALLVKYAAYGENNAPNAPIITGETSGTAGIEYEYTFNAVDPDGGDVYYWVQWGDSCPSVEWIGPFPSGVDVKLSHTYQNQGTYTISARAKDVFDAESPEGTLKVKMPRNRATYNSLFLKLLEQFPILQTLLQRLGLQ